MRFLQWCCGVAEYSQASEATPSEREANKNLAARRPLSEHRPVVVVDFGTGVQYCRCVLHTEVIHELFGLSYFGINIHSFKADATWDRDRPELGKSCAAFIVHLDRTK